MLMPGKMQEIGREIMKFNLDIVAIQETRWKGQGEIKKKDFAVYYSGDPNKTGQRGTGFFVCKKLMRHVIGFEPINDRLCKIRIKGRFRNITLLSAYAPIEDAADHDKETFYDQLTRAIEGIPRYDVTVLLGDFNAKIGKEPFMRAVCGPFTKHLDTSDNGKLLTQMAAANRLSVMSTYFQHLDIHLGTWIIPGTEQTNQIDHILVSTRHASSVTDVRACRGPNCDSDHYLVKMVLRERLSKAQKREPRDRVTWNQESFNEPSGTIRKKFEREINKELDTLKEEMATDSTNQKWEKLKNIVLTVTDEVIGEKVKVRNEWFDDECAQAIKRKNEARDKKLQRNTRQTQEEYESRRREANRVCRRKKRGMLNEKLKEIEEKRLQKQTRNFYKGTDWFRKEFKPRLTGCKDKQGKLLGEENDIMKRWTEYFNELLNRESNQQPGEAPQYLTAEPLLQPPTLIEVEEAVKRMKNFKAPGKDNITSEMLKYAGSELTAQLHEIITEVWESETMPKAWEAGIIVPVYKKGDKLECSNYRGITLLNVAYKVFSNLLLRRLSPYTEEIIGEYQCGFRPARGTMDQIFVVRQAMEKCYEHTTDLHMLFVDFRQAFDSILKDKLLSSMESQGIPKKLVSLVKMTMKNAKASVIIDGRYGEQFELSRGVRQGDALSATLFNLALQTALQNITDNGTIIYKSKMICAYADDIVIITRNERELKETFGKLHTEAEKVGLQINVEKTKYLVMSAVERRRIKNNLTVRGVVTFENVSSFVYLGAEVNNCNKTSQDVDRRIIAANKAYFANIRLLKSRLLSKTTKLRIYKTLIRPVATYGSETWNLTVNDANRLRVFERKIVRRIFGPLCEHGEWRIRNNAEIEQLLNKEDIVRFIKSQRLRWMGHVVRMTEDRMPKRMYKATMTGRRIQGRPRSRWRDEVESDLRKMKVRGWGTLVRDREEWRSIVQQAKAHEEL